MTPQELAVIQAAMELHYAVLAHPEALRPLHNANNALTPALSELNRTTYNLAVACPECNAGGHTCPGDGNPIPHGATDCGEHDDAVSVPVLDPGQGCPDRGSRLDPCPPGCTDTVCVVNQPPARLEPALIWVERTWADVRVGDRVRLPGSDAPPAHVQTCMHLHWHADPRSNQYQPEPLEWAGVHVKLDSNAERTYVMDPGKPVEIEIGEAEVHLLNALGWENRVEVIRDEAS